MTHVAVIRWEKAGDTPTAMSWGTEKDLRLFVASKLRCKPEEFVRLYAKLESKTIKRAARIELDGEKIAA